MKLTAAIPKKIIVTVVFVCVCVIFFASAAQMWAYGGRLKDNMSLHLQSVIVNVERERERVLFYASEARVWAYGSHL